jgi:hypothetical protein
LIAHWFAVVLPLFAADPGTNPRPAAAPAPTPALIPQAPDRYHAPERSVVDTGERINLRDAKDGSGDLLYDGNGFSARIAPDGTVSFSDKRLPAKSLLPWWPSNAPLARPSLQASLTNLLKGRKPPPPPPVDDRLPPPETTSVIPEVSRYRPDPREGCRACPGPENPVPTNFVPMAISPYTRGDLTDEIERFSGKDPNRYQKAMFLAATHDRRIEMAVKTHARNVRLASAELPGRLQLIACEPRLTLRERRAILAALAREMDTKTPEGTTAAAAIKDFLKRYDAGGVRCAPGP